MTLGDKLRYLREVEGTLRDLGRGMTQSEVAKAILLEQGRSISQAYLSQVENGHRRHLTDTTRMLLARFFKVHPGYLVGDPEGFHTELQSAVRAEEDSLDLWLTSGAERFSQDLAIREALLTLARNDDSRKCLLLIASVLQVPGLSDRLLHALEPQPAAPDLQMNKAIATRRRKQAAKGSNHI